MRAIKKFLINQVVIFFFLVFISYPVIAQYSSTHTRGKLWETLQNWGFIGDDGAWDYAEVTGIGFYPGFSGYSFPDHEEHVVYWPRVDANFHNFRSGPWIIVKNAQTLVPPDYHPEPREYLLYHSSMAVGEAKLAGVLYSNPPFQFTKNFVGSTNFNPLMPEEMNYCTFSTATGVTVKQRSMAWSFPDYDDFIIYDYTFINNGEIAIPEINKTMEFQQSLNEVWITFHSGISVSTKGFLNFHWDDYFFDSVAPAGGFGGWRASESGKGGFSDFYAFENDGIDGKGFLYYSRDYNGGREPLPRSMDPYQLRPDWQGWVRLQDDWLPELQDPACFGFLFLYRTPPVGANPDPFEADPNFFNVYSDERDYFKNKLVDFESFGPLYYSKKQLFEFATHNFLPPNEGNLYCWYTSTFGPYQLAPGDSIRLIVAEIAGIMDLKQVAMGDPGHWYPDSSIVAIRRNAEAARNAVKWGIGARVDGIELAADVPESPPAPNCKAVNISLGMDTAVIAIRWDRLAEETVINDQSGNIFYNGASDLSGYRIYRTSDDRGIWWDLVAEIPASEKDSFWNDELKEYEYLDKDLQFGFRFKYYVQAYYSNPRTWTSANGTQVDNLGELVSDDYNQTQRLSARPGPEDLSEGWDVFVVPNPYIEGDPDYSFGAFTPRMIEFRKLPESATIKIYSLSGDLIKTLEHGPDEYGNKFGSISWDQRSESGLLVAPGLYLYVVKSSTPGFEGWKNTGKFMIIR